MLRNLRIWQKFTVIAVFFCIPLIVLVLQLWGEASRNITLSKTQLDGTQYVRPIRKLIADIQTHRDLANAVLAGDTSFKADLDKSTGEVDKDLADVSSAVKRWAKEFGEDEKFFDPVVSDWGKVKADFATQKPEESFEAHSRLVRKVTRALQLAASDSNLVLSPDVDTYYTYYLQDHMFKNVKLSEEVSQARAIGMAFLASGAQGEINSNRKFSLAGAVVKVDDALQQVIDGLKPALDADKRVKAALEEPLATNTKLTQAFNAAVSEKVLNASTPIPVKDFWAMATGTVDAQTALAKADLDELDRQLKSRIEAMSMDRLKQVGIAGGLVALTVLLMFAVIRSITRPVAHLAQIADRISLGEMDAKIDIDSKDEIGELGERFRRLQVSLKAAMDQLEKGDVAEG